MRPRRRSHLHRLTSATSLRLFRYHLSTLVFQELSLIRLKSRSPFRLSLLSTVILSRTTAITHQATWIIRDNGRDVGTGCAADEIAAAERKLEDYIASKYTPKRRVGHIDDIPIADVLSIYLDAQLEKLRDRFKVDSEAKTKTLSSPYGNFKKRVEQLNAWWGAKMLGEVNGEACRSYRKKRRNRGGARRDLEDLRAAIGHHAAEGYHREIVKAPLPEKGEPRDKWLTRSDAAKLIWACWRYREMQKRTHRSPDDVRAPTAKRPLRAPTRGRPPAISECHLRFCSTPTATITQTICRMQSRKSRCARPVTNERRTYLVRFLVQSSRCGEISLTKQLI